MQRYDNDFYFNNYYEYEQGSSEPIFRGRLKASIHFWRDIGANSEVLDVISSGYKLPLIVTPASYHAKNNRSALIHRGFVSDAIKDLKDKHLITCCQSFICFNSELRQEAPDFRFKIC
jgi:hypothetical protein